MLNFFFSSAFSFVLTFALFLCLARFSCRFYDLSKYILLPSLFLHFFADFYAIQGCTEEVVYSFDVIEKKTEQFIFKRTRSNLNGRDPLPLLHLVASQQHGHEQDVAEEREEYGEDVL